MLKMSAYTSSRFMPGRLVPGFGNVSASTTGTSLRRLLVAVARLRMVCPSLVSSQLMRSLAALGWGGAVEEQDGDVDDVAGLGQVQELDVVAQALVPELFQDGYRQDRQADGIPSPHYQLHQLPGVPAEGVGKPFEVGMSGHVTSLRFGPLPPVLRHPVHIQPGFRWPVEPRGSREIQVIAMQVRLPDGKVSSAYERHKIHPVHHELVDFPEDLHALRPVHFDALLSDEPVQLWIDEP